MGPGGVRLDNRSGMAIQALQMDRATDALSPWYVLVDTPAFLFAHRRRQCADDRKNCYSERILRKLGKRSSKPKDQRLECNGAEGKIAPLSDGVN